MRFSPSPAFSAPRSSSPRWRCGASAGRSDTAGLACAPSGTRARSVPGTPGETRGRPPRYPPGNAPPPPLARMLLHVPTMETGVDILRMADIDGLIAILERLAGADGARGRRDLLAELKPCAAD